MQHTLNKAKPALIIPREHGMWAMFLAPFLLGVMLSDFNLLHVPAGFGLLAGFLAINALFEWIRRPKDKASVRRTILFFGLVSVICLALPLFYNWQAFWPMLIMVILLLVPIWFIRRKSERHFLNDLIGIIGLTMLLPIATELGNGASDHEVAFAMLMNILYFTGSVFFVKSVFREKANIRFHFIGIIYHLLVALLPFLTQIPALVSLLFLPGVLKMAVALKGMRLMPKTVGIIEIANVLWFLAWSGWLFR